MNSNKKRCDWALSSDLMREYHDKEWGVPAHNDNVIFQAFLLDSFQAGLSWSSILNKREYFKDAFDNFDFQKIAFYDAKKKANLMNNSGIVRNKLKIDASIVNSGIFLEVIEEYKTFNDYIWKFVNYNTITNSWSSVYDIPSYTNESEVMSKELKKRGMRFVGPTMCYAFMQGIGMVNDHLVSCFRYSEV